MGVPFYLCTPHLVEDAVIVHTSDMNHRLMREIAKVLSGVFAAKIFLYFWLIANNLQTIIFVGTPFEGANLRAALVFNIALLALFVYYGWHLKSPVHSPSERTLLLCAGALFFVVGLWHVLRVLFGWSFMMGRVPMPGWFSWAGLVLMFYLAYVSYHYALKIKPTKR